MQIQPHMQQSANAATNIDTTAAIVYCPMCALPSHTAQELIAAMNPLSNAGILQHMFTFLPGHWLFLGAVCKEWAAIYASRRDHLMVYCLNVRGWNHFNHYSPKTTLFRTVVASPAAVRMAHSCGLAVNMG
eukprot:839-Heterococcus_DN1.PRE.1